MQGYKREYKNYLGGIYHHSLSLSLSLSLSSSCKRLVDLIVGEGSAGQPPAGLSSFAGQDTDEGMSLISPRHRTKNCINKSQAVKAATTVK